MKKELVKVFTTKEEYIATDGTRFSSEDECLKYESTANGIINGKFCEMFGYDYRKGNGITAEFLYLWGIAGDDEVVSFMPNTQEELDALNMFMKLHSCGKYFGQEYLGNKLIFTSYDGEYYFQGTESEVRAKLEWNVNCVCSNHIPRCATCSFYDKDKLSCANDNGKYNIQETCKACYQYRED